MQNIENDFIRVLDTDDTNLQDRIIVYFLVKMRLNWYLDLYLLI